ncbi:MAG: hypothetical protein KIT09_35850 [Bryobacteraceae bacterium]|nr:hypothetical protein [Bryobacteraceae bacterium]
MKYELIGRPPAPVAEDALRRDFEAFLSELESSQSRVSVVFGVAWGNEIYERDWRALEMSGGELRARVGAAESSGLGKIGRDDLHITLQDVGVQRTYCHHAEIHVAADASTHPNFEALRDAWIRMYAAGPLLLGVGLALLAVESRMAGTLPRWVFVP